ncbi:hypothetical protein P168DRAFT_312091 [Aspergillus campestris IBT 28561]|uniref:Uncharacterized protein n=1 Tax=Aspergillus campestris (strain IBT 28561) TaxID=1392248 RepID=A0A2I1CYY6_ASPC2|nr:uncharacterized protein P168DRAFT_312091 [Aspergillus campestris IBT 28561]PKY02834.1 hypothetical protein P168DRAFT_312091 [Aspergillus campestris IBT 28561]
MNRFRKSRKEKAKEEVPATPAEAVPATWTPKVSKKPKKPDPEPPMPPLDFSTALPSNDDFRTSLLMPKLSARFSMLREQDDPGSMIGKASDDSVLFPKRASRLNLFGHNPNLLADIDEVSNDGSRPSFSVSRAASVISGVDGEGTDDDRSQKESIMSRARRVEGNNLFGGRQKVYKIPTKVPPADTAAEGPSAMGGRAVYDHDVGLSAFQRQRLRDKEDRAADDAQHEAQSPVAESTGSRMSSANRTTYSSTASGPTANGRTSTAATSIDEEAPFAGPPLGDPPAPPKSSQPGWGPERGSVKSRRLYGPGLTQQQQNSALSRLESLSRQRAGTPELPPLKRTYSRSATNLRDRLQRLGVADQTVQASRRASPPAFPASAASKEPGPAPRTDAPSPAGLRPAAPPRSPAPSDPDDASSLTSAVNPEDRGKATAMGMFNKPPTEFDENQFTRRQLQMHQGRSTPPARRPRRSRSGSLASSHYSDVWRPGSRSAATSGRASPAHYAQGTFLANFSPSESEDEDAVHSHARGVSDASAPDGPPAEDPHPLPEVRFSDLGDLKPIAEPGPVMGSAADEPSAQQEPDKPDSPTLGPSGLGLSGLVRTHLRRGSDRSSVFFPPSAGDPPSHPPPVPPPVAADHWARKSSMDSRDSASDLAWGEEMIARHQRDGSTATQRERDEFERELAERRRRVQEKLKGIAEADSRAGSPVSGRQTPDHGPVRPGNAFSMLKNRTTKGNLFHRPDSKAGGRVMGSHNTSAASLTQDDYWHDEEDRSPMDWGRQQQHSRSSSPHPPADRPIRSRMTAYGRSSQEDLVESRGGSRGASPHSSYRSHRNRSGSDASRRSKSRPPRDRDDLDTVEEVTIALDGYFPPYQGSVPPSTRPSTELEPLVYERSPSAASGWTRGDSRSATPSNPDRAPPQAGAAVIGAPTRPPPLAPYSANATPPLYELPPEPTPSSSTSASSTAGSSRSRSQAGLQKRAINKMQISEPTFVSSTSNVPLRGLPPGASLTNGAAGTPPIPPMNPRRRRQTTTQTLLGALKGDRHDSQHSASTASSLGEEQSNFSDEGEKRPRTRHRLRKISSEGGHLNARARQQVMAGGSGAPPPPKLPAEGGMF